jgi:hypothetical protein
MALAWDSLGLTELTGALHNVNAYNLYFYSAIIVFGTM